MARIHLVSTKHFEPWDWRNPDTKGIGGSETMHIEMACRLAARGHTVTSYTPMPSDTHGKRQHSVLWRDLADVDLDKDEPGLWIFIRGIEQLDHFEPRPDQRVWCVFQDVDTFGEWDESWLPKIDRIIGLCTPHCEYLRAKHPTFAEKICQSRNGIRGDLVDNVLGDPTTPPRQPHRLTYASSPDRGLYGLLEAFRLIRFLVPDAELHICYGFDNMQTVQMASVRHAIARIQRAAEQPGVVMRGRMAQPDLYAEWAKTAVMCAPTNFAETGFITLMEAQALGAIPVVNPIWAAAEYQLAGVAIPGDAERDSLTLRRYALATAHLLMNPQGQKEIRGPMMSMARKLFDWSGVVAQYEEWIKEDGL